MATVVLLSSSPPLAFARSPTPADTSPSLPSPSVVIRNAEAGYRRFKPADKTRDRFSRFSSARSLLSHKSGAENIPLRSPGKEKSKSQSKSIGGTTKNANSQPDIDWLRAEETSAHFDQSYPQYDGQVAVAELSTKGVNSTQGRPSSQPRSKGVIGPQIEVLSSPVQMEKAVPRRLDWTPAKAAHTEFDAAEQAVGVSGNLLQSFTFNGQIKEAVPAKQEGECGPMKRRRIDMVQTTEIREGVSLSIASSKDMGKPQNLPAKKRNRSPAKKALTITGLATTNYDEEHLNQIKIRPISEYLTATQVGGAVIDSEPKPGGKKDAKPKPPTKKSRVSKKTIIKSRLVSPTSAMKALIDQDMIFGSASQLAREESPSLIRDIIEATKRSELFLSSDPISPQRTQPISIETTSPQIRQGTSRFVKRRNLWGAAGRDQDNALLHVDTIDLIDSPAVRLALTGKDVLLQPASVTSEKSRPVSTEQSYPQKTPLAHKGDSLIDIDDIVTPGIQLRSKSPTRAQVRSYHTSTSSNAPRNSTGTASDEVVVAPAEKAAPTKPSYAGFTDLALQKQISAYGFKPVKKREKMIELLERCWEDKYGNDTAEKDENEDVGDVRTHADFLSKVHDVSARPVPKAKKPKAKRKSEADATTTPKEPKRRKKAEPKTKASTDGPKEKAPKKTPAKKKSKVSALSEEFVLDIDDLNDQNVENGGHSKGPVIVETTRPKTTGAKAKARARPKRPTTPPPTLPTESLISSPAFETRPEEAAAAEPQPPALGSPHLEDPTLSPTLTPPLPDLQSQIRAAIMLKPTSSTHPVQSTQSPSPKSKGKSKAEAKGSSFSLGITPTWREKMLMYDPIVLEDLTTWLNTEGFRAINEDREVSAFEVREWCEANGVCCYGIGGGWRGANGRK